MNKFKYIFFLYLLFILNSLAVAQPGLDKTGPLLTAQLGIGHSSYAATYFAYEQGLLKEYSGFRTLITDVKLGWGISEHLLTYYEFRFSPATSTVSPYRFAYHGIAAAYAFSAVPDLYVTGGMGWNQGSVKDAGKLGTGLATSIGMAFEPVRFMIMELKCQFGKMNPPKDLVPSPYGNREFIFELSVGYFLY